MSAAEKDTLVERLRSVLNEAADRIETLTNNCDELVKQNYVLGREAKDLTRQRDELLKARES